MIETRPRTPDAFDLVSASVSTTPIAVTDAQAGGRAYYFASQLELDDFFGHRTGSFTVFDLNRTTGEWVARTTHPGAPTRKIRVPAARCIDHRALAYDAARALADLTGHLDPALLASLEISTNGCLTVLLHTVPIWGRSASFRDAAQLAVRVGLSEHTTRPVSASTLHTWSGSFGGFAAKVEWFDHHDEADQ